MTDAYGAKFDMKFSHSVWDYKMNFTLFLIQVAERITNKRKKKTYATRRAVDRRGESMWLPWTRAAKIALEVWLFNNPFIHTYTSRLKRNEIRKD